MKYYLILLKDFNILVSDEEIKKHDFFLYKNNIEKCAWTHLYNIGCEGNFSLQIPRKDSFKIIAGFAKLPTIIYSDEVKQELRDKYGWVDLIELAKKTTKKYINEREKQTAFLEFIEGAKTIQSITDKMFSLEDMLNIYKEGYNDCFHKKGEWGTKYLIDRLQQPKMIEVEVEMEYYVRGNDFGDLDAAIFYRPKITNNSIKVTKLL